MEKSSIINWFKLRFPYLKAIQLAWDPVYDLEQQLPLT